MSTQIKGSKFIYEIDEKDFPHGFIAQGTESFVFKGRKISVNGQDEEELSFSCVLKFKPYSRSRFERFTNNELRIFEELQECRSVARIYDVIEDLGESFDLKTPEISKHIRSKSIELNGAMIPCFCVVEEYIDGWSLEQYCIRQFWGLEKFKDNRWIKYHEFKDFEKEEVLKKYKDEKTFFRYQDKMLHYMLSLCGILQFISMTSKKKVLHLDIKPENIMVTSQSEELVLIDFGRSEFLDERDRYIYHKLAPFKYINDNGVRVKEDINHPFCHGTIGYAAPEAFRAAIDDSFPLTLLNDKSEDKTNGFEIGRMSIESDIFSFGATFWECLNIVELVTNSEEFSTLNRKSRFYESHLLNHDSYYERDLSLECTGPLGGRYNLALQNIIKKCTRKRLDGYMNDPAFYHGYDEIIRDLEDARDSIPTVKKGENKQVKNSSITFGICIGCFLSLLLISGVYRAIGARIAKSNWNNLVSEINNHIEQGDSAYQTTKQGELSEIALERMELATGAQELEVCDETFVFLCNDNVINSSEATLMITLLNQLDDNNDKIQYADKIIEHANPVELSSIAASVNSLGLSTDDIGYKLAIALYCVDRENDYDYVDAYDLIVQNANLKEYRTIIKMLAVTLNNKGDYVINQIAEKKSVKRSEVIETLNSLEKM
ncbi:MAG: AarF/UbiB family protein [Ruminococcus sp.]|nr:AarF/UbiB family protein [Ruminococcus sp.]